MQLTITGVDYAPPELEEQVPIVVDLLRVLPGPDRPDYWLGQAQKPIRWLRDNHEVMVSHVIIGARWVGTQISPGVKDLPVGIAYVTDHSLLADSTLDFAKCSYVAIGFSLETGDGNKPHPTKQIQGGMIGRFFGLGNNK